MRASHKVIALRFYDMNPEHQRNLQWLDGLSGPTLQWVMHRALFIGLPQVLAAEGLVPSAMGATTSPVPDASPVQAASPVPAATLPTATPPGATLPGATPDRSEASVTEAVSPPVMREAEKVKAPDKITVASKSLKNSSNPEIRAALAYFDIND